MIRLVTVTAAVIWLFCQSAVAEKREQPYEDDWYFERYLFMNKPGRPYTFESEFVWPEGFERIDSTRLSPFQHWVSHIPLWHRGRPVNAGIKGEKYPAEEVTRPIQFQWRVMRLADFAIPVQLHAEYYLSKDQFQNWSFRLKNGERLEYTEFLKGRPVFRPGEGYSIKHTEERKSSQLEINKMLDLCTRNTTYSSLAANCDSITAEELMPGDLIIGHNERGIRGQAWIVLNVIENEQGDRLYVVGTGCPDQCAFYIPKFNSDRHNPWIDLEQVRGLISDYSFFGFFRLQMELE